MKVKGNLDNFYEYAFPSQAVLVTCKDENNKTNVLTIAWHTTISKKPPLFGISVGPTRYSHDLIKNSKEFVVNFVPYDLVDKVHFCGTNSGRNIDKIKHVNLNLQYLDGFQTPIIKECYAHLFCKLYKSIELGDHTFFVGKVVSTLYDENAFVNNILDNKKIQPCYYIGGNTYTTICESGKQF